MSMTQAQLDQAQKAVCDMIAAFVSLVDALDPCLRIIVATWGARLISCVNSHCGDDPCATPQPAPAALGAHAAAAGKPAGTMPPPTHPGITKAKP